MIDVNDLIGLPFRENGRGSGYDCYGLAIEVSRRFGHGLKDLVYEGHEEKDFFRNFEEGRSLAGDSVTKTDGETEAGDLVVFKDSKGRRVHIGVMLERDDFIHCDCRGVRVTRLRDYGKKYEVFRWQE